MKAIDKQAYKGTDSEIWRPTRLQEIEKEDKLYEEKEKDAYFAYLLESCNKAIVIGDLNKAKEYIKSLDCFISTEGFKYSEEIAQSTLCAVFMDILENPSYWILHSSIISLFISISSNSDSFTQLFLNNYGHEVILHLFCTSEGSLMENLMVFVYNISFRASPYFIKETTFITDLVTRIHTEDQNLHFLVCLLGMLRWHSLVSVKQVKAVLRLLNEMLSFTLDESHLYVVLFSLYYLVKNNHHMISECIPKSLVSKLFKSLPQREDCMDVLLYILSVLCTVNKELCSSLIPSNLEFMPSVLMDHQTHALSFLSTFITLSSSHFDWFSTSELPALIFDHLSDFTIEQREQVTKLLSASISACADFHIDMDFPSSVIFFLVDSLQLVDRDSQISLVESLRYLVNLDPSAGELILDAGIEEIAVACPEEVLSMLEHLVYYIKRHL